MLVAAAVCPHPPLIVPEVAAGAAAELDGLRAACDRALYDVLGAAPELLVVVGGGDATREFPAGTAGSLAGYGIDIRTSLGPDGGGPPVLPLSLTIGAWLVSRSEWGGPIRGQEIAAAASPEECRHTGERLAVAADRVALLVMGDGAARRSAAAPGGFDSRAEPFDARVAAALLRGDPADVLGIDSGLADELMVGGRAAWQVLAGAVADEQIDAEVLYDAAPYGVGYLVAVWEWHG